jgi:hypothetical protein
MYEQTGRTARVVATRDCDRLIVAEGDQGHAHVHALAAG